jgi:Leu/Phe-tRNA-protein transferase
MKVSRSFDDPAMNRLSWRVECHYRYSAICSTCRERMRETWIESR